MALDLNDRSALKKIVKEERIAYASGESVRVPQKLDGRVAAMLAGLSQHDVSIEEDELRSKTKAAMGAGKGKLFVSARTVMKELDQWVAPMRPAPVEPEAEEEGEAEG